MKQDAADRFMGDPIGGCNSTQRFVLFHHPMNDCRPVFSGKTVFGVFRPWSTFADHRRRADVTCFIVNQQVLHLEIQEP
jgi:hypothetical protein